jgi:hypothetical protein
LLGTEAAYLYAAHFGAERFKAVFFWKLVDFAKKVLISLDASA